TPPQNADSKSLLPAPVEPPICRACALPKPNCLSSACRWNPRPSKDSIPFCPSRKCLVECPSAPWPLESLAPSTPPCLPPRCWETNTPSSVRLTLPSAANKQLACSLIRSKGNGQSAKRKARSPQLKAQKAKGRV